MMKPEATVYNGGFNGEKTAQAGRYTDHRAAYQQRGNCYYIQKASRMYTRAVKKIPVEKN